MAKQANGLSGEHSRPLQDFLQILDATKATSFADDGGRSQALEAVYALVSQLETLWETTWRLYMGQVSVPTQHSLTSRLKRTQPALGATLKVMNDLQLSEKWHERGDEATTREQLAEAESCDPILLGQSLRLISSDSLHAWRSQKLRDI